METLKQRLAALRASPQGAVTASAGGLVAEDLDVACRGECVFSRWLVGWRLGESPNHRRAMFLSSPKLVGAKSVWSRATKP